jgi:hypothetical protein
MGAPAGIRAEVKDSLPSAIAPALSVGVDDPDRVSWTTMPNQMTARPVSFTVSSRRDRGFAHV